MNCKIDEVWENKKGELVKLFIITGFGRNDNI
jgi:hypothetical protein